jgi:hypothetical protein
MGKTIVRSIVMVYQVNSTGLRKTDINVAHIKGLVQKALHRGAGKFKGSSNTRAFPVPTITVEGISEPESSSCVNCVGNLRDKASSSECDQRMVQASQEIWK